MRASGGTDFGLPSVVVACTKSRIAFFAGLSFQEGSGSDCARAPALTSTRPQKRTASVRAKRNDDHIASSLRIIAGARSVVRRRKHTSAGTAQPRAEAVERRSTFMADSFSALYGEACLGDDSRGDSGGRAEGLCDRPFRRGTLLSIY